MSKHLLVWAACAAMGSAAQAQDIYTGLGLPGVLSLGFAQPMGMTWGLRAEYAGGLSINKDGWQDGVNVTGSLKANRAGVFADWFPFESGFRLVAGMTINDIRAHFNALGSGTATINGQTVDMTGEVLNLDVTYPTLTPYLGIGYGHQFSRIKGLGFYADLGVTIGKFDTDVATTLIGKTFVNGTTITTSDIDAQTKTMRDSITSLSVLPNFSLGLTYRY